MRTIFALLFALGNIFASGSALARPTHEVRDLASGQIKSCECNATPDELGLRCINCTTATKVQASNAQFPIWKTVTIGTHRSIADLRTALDRADVRLSWYTDYFLDRTYLYRRPMVIDLVKLSVADLGFQAGATRQEIYARARERGLELCPREVGPALRLTYMDQPMDDWLIIGMEPITGPGGRPVVFRVVRLGDGLWLDNDWALPDDEWGPESTFVFRLPASVAASAPASSGASQ